VVLVQRLVDVVGVLIRRRLDVVGILVQRHLDVVGILIQRQPGLPGLPSLPGRNRVLRVPRRLEILDLLARRRRPARAEAFVDLRGPFVQPVGESVEAAFGPAGQDVRRRVRDAPQVLAELFLDLADLRVVPKPPGQQP
jgi:hypothetical protein